MGDANPIRTLEDYSKPSHKGYKNTIELPVGNNVVPLRSDTIRVGAKWMLIPRTSVQGSKPTPQGFLNTCDAAVAAVVTRWSEGDDEEVTMVLRGGGGGVVVVSGGEGVAARGSECIVKNVDSVGNFLMYPRFVQVFVNQQVSDMSNHKRIYVTPSHTKKIFGNMKREGKGFSGRVTPLFPTMMKKQKPRNPKKKDTQPSGPTTNVADKADNEENVYKHSNDPLFSGKDSLKLEELMALFGLSRRVESSEESLGEEDTSKHGRKIDDIDVDEGVTLVDETQGRYGDDQMFDVSDLAGEHVFVAEQGVPNSKKDDVVSTADATQATVQDKGKGKIVKPEPMKKFSKKDQIRLDEELAFKLQAEEKEEERLSMEKVEANVSLIEEWNDIQENI
ncbi:hypothetical protein Tco_0348182 [Tanacetum coccineum]